MPTNSQTTGVHPRNQTGIYRRHNSGTYYRVGHTPRVGIGTKLLGYATVMVITIYLSWRLFYTLPFSYGYLSIAMGAVLFICEFISGAQAIINYLSQIRPLELERPPIPDSWFPDIDVFISTHDEDVNLLYNTVNACRYLHYPDKSKVHVHICDDGNRQEMRELAGRLGVNYIGMAEPKHAKAGNINNALQHTGAPLIAFLDADMIPRREFLVDLVPYFFLPRLKKDKDGEWYERKPEEINPKYKIGYIQSPQNFYNPDLFQYNLYAEDRVPNEQIYFFREVNVSRNRDNSSLMCGSNVIISRQALADAGNFATNTITEDFETGIRIQNAGYRTYTVTDVLANGLAPETVPDLIAQRERWGRGAMQTFYNVRPFLDFRIPLGRRIGYLCTLFYWLSFFCRFMFIMSPILVALFNVFLVECSLLEVLVFWLPYYVLHNIALARISEKTRTVNWSNVIDTVMFPFLFIPVMLDMVGIRLRRFRVTGKGRSNQTSTKPSLILPHALMFVMSVVGIVISLMEVINYGTLYNLFILFWLVVNSKSLLLAIFFMLGRVNERYSYRLTVKVKAELELNGSVYSGITTDVSEGGFSIALDYPAYIPPDVLITARLYDREYSATFLCTMVQVRRTKDSDWTYSIKLKEIAPDQLSQFRQIIYERNPTLPEVVNETMPVIEDIKVNFDKRFGKQTEYFSRTLPRVWQSATGTLPDGRSVTLNDFNYDYVQMNPKPALGPGETAIIALESGMKLEVALPEEDSGMQSRNLFRIINRDDWVTNPQYQRFLSQWSRARQSSPTREGPYASSEAIPDVFVDVSAPERQRRN